MKRTERFTFFWGGEFSNWYKRSFTVKGVKFNCGEQYMMYSKAMVFNDPKMAEMIMKIKEPKKQKELGRLVKGYNDEVWRARSPSIMKAGLLCKFLQHRDLADLLISTLGTRLVEASPHDTIWGVGLSETDPLILDEANWKGLNELGKVLDAVRSRVFELTAARESSPTP